MSPSYRRYRTRPEHPGHLFWRRVTAAIAAIGFVVFSEMSVASHPQDSKDPDASHADMPMGVRVAADRISIGNEFLPRRTDLSSKLIVSSGQTVELPEDATYDYVEVAGTLKVSRTRHTTTRVT